MSDDKPLSEEELRAKIASAKIVMAPTEETDNLWPEIRIILSALSDLDPGFGSALVTDETCFSDFCLDDVELRQVGKSIGCDLDPACEDDWWMIRVAAKMRRNARLVS